MDSHSENRGFEFIEHEGEMGVYCWGGSLEALFQAAAEGLYTIMRSSFTLLDRVDRTIELKEEAVDLLLRAFLAELVFYESVERLIFPLFHFSEITSTHLFCRARGGHYDPHHEPLEREVKAVTYYRLSVEKRDARWEAIYIVDV